MSNSSRDAFFASSDSFPASAILHHCETLDNAGGAGPDIDKADGGH
jgi:hypothetical protein